MLLPFLFVSGPVSAVKKPLTEIHWFYRNYDDPHSGSGPLVCLLCYSTSKC